MEKNVLGNNFILTGRLNCMWASWIMKTN